MALGRAGSNAPVLKIVWGRCEMLASAACDLAQRKPTQGARPDCVEWPKVSSDRCRQTLLPRNSQLAW